MLGMLGLLGAGCSSAVGASRGAPERAATNERDRTCMRYAIRVAGPYHQDLADPVDDPRLEIMPKEARRTARAGGLEPLILAALEAEKTGQSHAIALLTLRQELFMRLVSLGTQLESVLSEIECTDDVVEELAAELEARERKRELRWTLASIVVGAGAATWAGAWELAQDASPGGPTVGVAGGIASAGLGLFALLPRTHTMRYTHAHNLLTFIVRGEDPERAYPTFVRRLFEAPGHDGARTPREELYEEFETKLAATYPESERAEVRRILYGAGGTYDQRMIGLRESLYDALEAKLSTFARELELLTRYLVNFSVGAEKSVAE